MKHKLCLLSRKNTLNPGIYVDEAYPEIVQKWRMSLPTTHPQTSKNPRLNTKANVNLITTVL